MGWGLRCPDLSPRPVRRLKKVSEDTLAEAQSFDKRTRLLFENDEVAQADVVKAGTRRAATAPR